MGLPRLHLFKKDSTATKLTLNFRLGANPFKDPEKKSLKLVFLTLISHESFITIGCLCRHGRQKDPGALFQSPGCDYRAFSQRATSKINSICPPSGITHEPDVFAHLTVKYMVARYAVLSSSNAPTFLENFMLR